MIVELTPEARALAELALPPIFTTQAQRDTGQWPKAYYPDRIVWYTRMTVESGMVLGGCGIIPEFIAAMIWESGLDNLAPGNNAKNGTPYSAPGFPSLGTGWTQLDTAWSIDDLAMMHAVRRDPLTALHATIENPDLAQTRGNVTVFNKDRWHAWEWDTIDPPAAWSAYAAAQAAWAVVSDE